MAAKSRAECIDLDVADATSLSEAHDLASARRSALPDSEKRNLAEASAVSAARNAARLKRRKKAKPRSKAERDAELDAAYAACGSAFAERFAQLTPEQTAEIDARTKAGTLSSKALQRMIDHLPVSKTPRQVYLVNKDDHIAHQTALYRDCPWSPRSYNATQSGESRVKEGYVFEGSAEIALRTGSATAGLIGGKYFQNRFVQRGYKTGGATTITDEGETYEEAEPLLMRIIQAIPAENGRRRKNAQTRARMLTGPRKDDRRVYPNKRSANDCVYASTSNLLQLIRVDIDKPFQSINILLAKLQFLVDEGKLPCMPHFVVWIFDDRFPGWVLNPHLLWLLPADKCVWAADGGMKQKILYDRVVTGLTVACLDEVFLNEHGEHEGLGADFGGMANPSDFKNPVSPHCHYVIANGTHFPDLGEMSESLSCTLDRESMARLLSIKAMTNAGLSSQNSQRFWTWAYKAVFEVARELYLGGNAAYDPRSHVFDVDTFEEEIARISASLVPDDIKARNSTEETSCLKAITTRARFVAWNFDPNKIDDPGIDRGACAEIIPPTANVRERQQISQLRTCEVRVDASRELILGAYRHALANGLPTTHVAIANASGRHVNTVARYARDCRQQAQHELSSQFIMLLGAAEQAPRTTPENEPLGIEPILSDVKHAPTTTAPTNPQLGVGKGEQDIWNEPEHLQDNQPNADGPAMSNGWKPTLGGMATDEREPEHKPEIRKPWVSGQPTLDKLASYDGDPSAWKSLEADRRRDGNRREGAGTQTGDPKPWVSGQPTLDKLASYDGDPSAWKSLEADPRRVGNRQKEDPKASDDRAAATRQAGIVQW
ncbi:hypothetical protein ABIF52_007016 [Bradyrhizobium japonicum]